MSLVKRTWKSASLAFCFVWMLVPAASAQQTDDPFASNEPATAATPTAAKRPGDPGDPFAMPRKEEAAPSIDQNDLKTEMALNKNGKFDYFEQRFGDVIEEIASDLELDFVMHDSIRENNLDEETLITTRLNNSRYSMFLDTVLDGAGCTYVVKDGVVFLVSQDAAIDERWLQLRDFDCRQLVRDQFQGDDVALVSMIQELVESASWGRKRRYGSHSLDERPTVRRPDFDQHAQDRSFIEAHDFSKRSGSKELIGTAGN